MYRAWTFEQDFALWGKVCRENGVSEVWRNENAWWQVTHCGMSGVGVRGLLHSCTPAYSSLFLVSMGRDSLGRKQAKERTGEFKLSSFRVRP